MPAHSPIRRPVLRSAHAPPFDGMTFRFLCAATIMAVGCALAASARAEAVVVASTAPGYRLGQVVGDGEAVRLPDGASAMFLFASGRTVRLRGPFEGDPGAVTEARPAGGQASDRFMQSDLGAARAFGNPLDKAMERALALDPVQAGVQCVKAGALPTLRRPDDPALSRVVLQDGRGASATVTWTGAAAPWPRELDLRDGTEVRVAAPDGTPRAALRIRQLEAPGNAALAVRMAQAGCGVQAGAVLASLRDAVVPLDLYLAADRPAYKAGDEVRLTLQTNRDAHVYCYLRTARAQLIPIFPAGAGKSALVAGDAPLTLPGERMPLPLQAGAGEQEVRCLAAGRSLDGELPAGAEAFRPLDEASVARFDRTVARLRDDGLAMAQIVVKAR